MDPVFIVDDVVHYCVANMPGAVARTSTIALTNATLALGLSIAGLGLEAAVTADECLRRGVNTYKGHCTFEGVAESFGIEYTDIKGLLR
jgi:alanine dehydrogenase